MKRIYLLFPLLALTAFAGYYSHWKTRHDAVAYSCPKFRLDPYENRDGHQEAVADLARGQLRVLGYGLPAHWTPEYREVLLREKGIEYRAIAGCVVTTATQQYAAAYNQVMEQRIFSLHGPHVFDDAATKAEALYSQRHPPLVRD